MLTVKTLKRFVPFSGFDQQFLSEALEYVHVTTAKKGTIIFKRGKNLADKFFLLEGEVHLINNDFGSEKVEAKSERASMALNIEGRSRVSVIAKTPIAYFTINIEELERLCRGRVEPPIVTDSVDSDDDSTIQVNELSSEEDWMSCLLQSPLFDRIPMAQLQELFLKFETMEVTAGEVVVKEGAKGDYFYVIAAGEAHISDRSASIHVDLSTGKYFGEEALISSAPRNASVTMKTKGILKRLCAEDFTALVKSPVLQYLDNQALNGLQQPYKVLDVRLPIEYRMDHVPGSINVPLSRLRSSIPELAQNNTYVVSDQGGSRADIAAYLLCQAGFDAFVLKGELAEQGTELI